MSPKSSEPGWIEVICGCMFSGKTEELIRRFPKSRYSDQAQFMIGYTYDQQGLLDKAREAYQKVIDNFPDSELVDDAKISIANLGKPPEAWFPTDTTDSSPGK